MSRIIILVRTKNPEWKDSGFFCVYFVGVLAEEGEEIGRDG